MKLKEIKERIIKNVKWSIKRPNEMGGQQCGTHLGSVVLKSEELDLEITIGYYRSQNKNKKLAFTLFELALDELVN